MCGIFGAISDDALSDTLQGLQLLEYRGYDSAGVATKVEDGRLIIKKRVGRVNNVVNACVNLPCAKLSIGHTRWATHGEVCERNAHPFVSQDGRFALVHNGILDNYIELRQHLTNNNVTLVSDTDSEAAVQLVMQCVEQLGDVTKSVIETGRRLCGSFAIAILDRQTDNLYLLRRGSPLYVGMSDKGSYLSSDVNTLRYYCSNVAVLSDNACVVLSRSTAVQYNLLDGKEIPLVHITVQKKQIGEEGKGDAMLREIFEIPSSLQRTFDSLITQPLCPDEQQLHNIKRIYLIGCGTAYHSCLIGAQYIRKFCNVTVEAVLASEWWYSYYTADSNTLVIAVTQSGETADTLNAAKYCKQQGATVYAVTNVEGSTVTFLADKVILIKADTERAVASTKAYVCQVLALTMFALDYACKSRLLTKEQRQQYMREFDSLPNAVKSVLDQADGEVYRLSQLLAQSKAVYFIGRGTDYFTAREGSLKLKEVSYIHSEAYASGELKHGTLAMIENGVTVVGIVCDSNALQRHTATVNEIRSRGAKVVTVTAFTDMSSDFALTLPQSSLLYYPILSVVPLQLLAYQCAVLRGCDADKPRNLAKSVTVE